MNNTTIEPVHIVIIEDVEATAVYIASELRETFINCSVSIMNNEAAFITELPNFDLRPPDIFIMDLMLRPGVENTNGSFADSFYAGLRCAQRLLDNQNTADCLIILMSGIQREDDIIDRLKSFPANVLFFPKPVDKIRLYIAMESFLAAKGNKILKYTSKKINENIRGKNMETKFIRVLATLGIPGVALGIFYLLLKAFKFQFAQVDGTWTAAIVILFLLLVGAITLFALHRWAPVRHTEPPVTRNENIPLNVQNKPTQKIENKPSKPANISALTVNDIIDDINNAAPFQRDAVAQNYHGIKVNWKGNLWDINKSLPGLTGQIASVKLNADPDNLHYGILFDVSISKYPQLKVARSGDLMGVLGRIVACSGAGMYVKLDVDKITFYEKTQE